MRIAFIADQHGFLPEIPDADLLIIAGDMNFTRKGDWQRQLRFINGPFHQWIEDLAVRMDVALIAGNHDEIFEKHYRLINKFSDNVYYLNNSGCQINGLNIWGSPQTLFFYDWAFNEYPSKIKKYWDAIPQNTDILVVHQPPYGTADLVACKNPREDESVFDGEHIGCPALRDKILEIQPTFVVCGHLHKNYGIHDMPGTINTKVVSCSHVDDDYKNPRPVIVLDL